MNRNELFNIGVEVRVNPNDIAIAGAVFFIAIVLGFAVGGLILKGK
jgi:hypothetical protein